MLYSHATRWVRQSVATLQINETARIKENSKLDSFSEAEHKLDNPIAMLDIPRNSKPLIYVTTQE